MGLTEVQICFLVGLFVIIGCAGVVSLDNYYIRKSLSSIEKLLAGSERKESDPDGGASDEE